MEDMEGYGRILLGVPIMIVFFFVLFTFFLFFFLFSPFLLGPLVTRWNRMFYMNQSNTFKILAGFFIIFNHCEFVFLCLFYSPSQSLSFLPCVPCSAFWPSFRLHDSSFDPCRFFTLFGCPVLFSSVGFSTLLYKAS